MPRVEIPQSRRVIPTGTGITRAPDLTAQSREVQRSGARVADLAGEVIQREKVRKDTVYVANASVQAERDIEELKKQLRAELETPEGHTNNFFELSSDVYNGYAQNAPSQEATLSLQQQFAGLQRGRLREETAFENSAIKARDLSAYEESSTVLDNTLFENPDEFELVLAQQGQLDETLKGILSPAQAATATQARQEALATAYVKGLINRDPNEALEVLKSDSLDDVLSSRQQSALENSANTQTQRNNASAQREFNKSHRIFVDNVKRDILTGEADQGTIDQLFNDESLTPDEFVSLSRMNNQKLDREADQVFSNAFIGESLRQGVPLDPTDDKVVDAVDNYYTDIIAPRLEELEKDEANMAEISFINDVGIVPRTIIKQVNAGISTGSDSAKADAAKFITTLGFSNPRLSNQFSVTNLAIAEKISTNMISMSVEDAVQAAEVSVLERETEQYRAKLRVFNIDRPEFDDGRFTDSFFEFFDGLPDTVPPGMEDRFVDGLKSYVVDLEVPMDRAVPLMYRTLLKEWSVTDINGAEEYMRFSPESVYSTPQQGNEWIKTQLRQDVSAIRGKAFDEDEDFFFSPIPTTFGSAGGVKYYIYETNPVTGFEEVIKDRGGTPMLWSPSPQQETIRLAIAAEEQKRRITDEKISEAEMNKKTQEDRGSTQFIGRGF